MNRYTFLQILLLVCLLASCGVVGRAQGGSNLAPGAPGKDAQWANAGKTAVGTSVTTDSKVWFTLRDGGLTEVYYPTVDVANTRLLEFVVVSGAGANRRVELESTDATHQTEIVNSQALVFRQVNTAKSGAWTLTKTYATDPERHTLLIDVQMAWRAGARQRCPCALYVYYDPSLGNSGMHDSAWTQGDALLASDADKSSALLSSTGFGEASNGYFETSDGLTQLRRYGRIANPYLRAADGNVVQLALVRAPNGIRTSGQAFTLALGFGREPDEALKNARASLSKGFARVRAEYESGWSEYVKALRSVAPKYEAQFRMAAMVLKAHEDKTFRGAMIASLSVPWGGGANANEPNVGGYHLVWSRDLYQVATAFYALGDKAAADRALGYLFNVQQKPDGSFPQNSWLDGRPFWGSLQLDEVAYPLVLAYQLGRTDNETWTKHVKPAADFLVRTGPRTPQERWEEKSGYSPSTIAAEIAALVCAAEIARRNDDAASSVVYLAAADEWQRNVERWTATTTGTYGDKNYYLRLTDNDDPNDGAPFNVGNGGGTFDEREIVDAGFLELVRLGIKRADDPLVLKSLPVVDKAIMVETPNGASWYRYTHDGYGEMDDGRPWNFDGKYTGKGRLWALLTGERGEFELASGHAEQARARLDAMLRFANEGMMLPEQIWDSPTSPRADLQFGEGTGSATPLAWSMAEFVRLAASLEEGRNVSLPDIVAARYVKGTPPADARAAEPEAPSLRPDAGATFPLRLQLAPRSRAYVVVGRQTRELPVDGEGRVGFDLPVPAGETFVALATLSPSGATSFQRADVRGLTPEERQREAQPTQAEQSPAFVERLRNARTSPLVKEETATFIYRGAAKRVEVVGDFTNWSPGGLVMRDVPGTNMKYLSQSFPKTARVEYKLIADGEWMLDPLNPSKLDNGVGGENSVLTMPGYRAPADAEASSVNPDPKLETAAVPSRLLGGTRKISVYLPRAYAAQAQERYPVLYVQDGSEYARRGHAALVAARLVEQGRVAPFIIVFVDPENRMRDYWASDQFADFMATELVPYVDARYRTRAERGSRALLGASLGGVISVWTALRHPDTFARVGGQSSAFQIDEERVVTALSRLDAAQLRERPFSFYLDVGRFESLLKVNRRVQVMLAAKGCPVVYQEAETGHNYTAWRDRLADAYLALWR